MIMLGEAILPALGRLNARFGIDGIYELAARRADFLPGPSFNENLAGLVAEPGTAAHKVFMAFLAAMPQTFHKTFVALIGHALSSEPPTLVNFAWAPGYDYELTHWYVPEPPPHMSGITVLLRSRYPEDSHPLAGAVAT